MMRPYGEDLKVYLCREPVDMRKARNGLAALAQEAMKLDPFSGALMVFVGRRFNAVKILYWSRNGFAKPSTQNPWCRFRVETSVLPMAPMVRS